MKVEVVDITTIAKIRLLASQRITVNGQERYGQAIFNVACQIVPIQANSLRGTIYDPFYDDSRIELFLKKLQK